MADKEIVRRAVETFIEDSYGAVKTEVLAALDRMAADQAEFRVIGTERFAASVEGGYIYCPFSGPVLNISDAMVDLAWRRKDPRFSNLCIEARPLSEHGKEWLRTWDIDENPTVEGSIPSGSTWLERKGYGRLRRDRPTPKAEAVKESLTTEKGGDANCAKHTAATDSMTGASTVTESAKPDSLTSDAAPVFEGGSNPSQDAGAATPASWRKLVESGEWPEYEAATPAGTPPTHITVAPECPTCSNPAHLDGDGKMLVVGGRIAAALESIAEKLEVLVDLRRC